ncbi:MAG TPA: lysophospholipid acyltransferase family protein [Acidimicrobiales bacterium]|nr:lysophospholipid acyltransferase family protein [Acidimicrobiales bacterium]
MARPVADGVMARLARVLVNIFFRQVEVEHRHRLSGGQPTVLVANHTNGLVDALLLMASLPRFPRFLGKSTLFSILPLRPFLRLAGVVPVYRAKDGESTAKNADAFRQCRRLLGEGGLVALFPEGVSHDEPSLQPLKTGAARIALGAAFDDEVPGIVTTAVGIAYDSKARFRSRALVRVGPPEPVPEWVTAYRADGPEAVRGLTEELSFRLRSIGPDYESWQQAAELARVAEVLGRDGDRPNDVGLVAREHLANALASLEADGTVEGLGQLRAAFDRYERRLTTVGLTDEQLLLAGDGADVRLVLAWSLGKVVLSLPLVAVGTVVHVVPYTVVKRLARLPTNEGMKATVKLLGCFASFSLVYVGLGTFVGLRRGPLAGLVALATGPLCGYVTVQFAERVVDIGRVLVQARVGRGAEGVLDGLRADRAEVVALGERLLGAPVG